VRHLLLLVGGHGEAGEEVGGHGRDGDAVEGHLRGRSRVLGVVAHEERAVELRVAVVLARERGARVRGRRRGGGDHGADGAVRRRHVRGAKGAVLFVGALEHGGGFVG